MKSSRLVLVLGSAAVVAASACTAGPPSEEPAAPNESADALTICSATGGGRAYSKYKSAFFGDLHLHTQSSLDAYSFGTRSSPYDAYLFARGMKSITIGTGTSEPPGPTVSIDRPLDFLAVTDHSEFLGVIRGCVDDPNSGFYDDPYCAMVRSTKTADQGKVFLSLHTLYARFCGTGSVHAAECAAEQRTAWQEAQLAAAAANDPCKFTSFVAYEWSSTPNGITNHRNVIFGSAVVPASPLDSVTKADRVALWQGLEDACKASSGCAALTIPHNTNMSRGTSIDLPASANEARLARAYQPLVEIYQHKGASECFYDPSAPADAACAFEYLSPGDAGDVKASYVRSALASGVGYAIANPTQGNPLQLGIVGATDDHNATPGHVREDAFTGHTGRLDDTPTKRLTRDTRYGGGGLTAVWAEQNTRASLFAALQRRETYATSGPRMTVRFYQTSVDAPCTSDFPKTIVDLGKAVPMGSSFRSADVGAGGAPLFAIAAWPDTAPQPLADGTSRPAPLATVQVIKSHGKKDASGAVVMVEDGPVDVPITPAGQCLTWRDPHFDAAEQAVYYVRVLQAPTFRWSHFDCLAAPTANPSGCAQGLDTSIRERAWTSPIWYAP